MTQCTTINRRQALALATAGMTSAFAPMASFAKTANSPVLVELFTSQGCSSCPPADKVAAGLTARKDLIVLSYNVDYWDYLGWRDTLASPDYSQRQYDYARTRGDGRVYTPQMIINGDAHVVGSQKSTVEAAIAAAEAAPLGIDIRLQKQEIIVELPAQTAEVEATLWLVAVATSKTQVIERGENAGETITYHNVVRKMVPAAMWNGEAFKGRWMRDAVLAPDCKTCVAILQHGKTGKVLAIGQA